jgi:hypothetical protein
VNIEVDRVLGHQFVLATTMDIEDDRVLGHDQPVLIHRLLDPPHLAPAGCAGEAPSPPSTTSRWCPLIGHRAQTPAPRPARTLQHATLALVRQDRLA